VQAVNTGDLAAILKNYADDAVVLTPQGPLEGKPGVEAFFRQAFSLLPQAQVSAKQVVSTEAALLVWWGAESPKGRVDDGVDTFVFERGLIKLQSISFSPQLNQ
jgi:ketosteroid isomerase-like protein